MTARDRAARRELGYCPATRTDQWPTEDARREQRLADAHARLLARNTPPPIAGTADTEREARIDAERVTLEFAQRSTKRADSGKLPIEFSPLFGGDPQQSLFEEE